MAVKVIKFNLKERIKVLMSGTYSTHIADFISGADVGGSATIDTDLAMRYSAVSACVRVLSETLASVPIMLYQKTDEGRDAITNNILYDVLHFRPNPDMSPFNFKETLMTNFTTSGNSVSKKLYNSKRELIGLFPYSQDVVKIDRNETTGKLEYKIKGKTKDKTLQRKDVLHIPNLSFDGIIGLSPITYAAKTIRLGLSYEQSQVELYRNAVNPSGTFTTPDTLSDESFDRLDENLKKSYAGLTNTGKPMILEGGLEWKQMRINPTDAQLLENKYFSIEDIARIYRVPPHLIQDLRKSTNNNIEQQSLEFVMYTMLPIFKRFEDNINTQLLTLEEQKAGLYFEFKIASLLRGDAKSRAEAYAKGREGGYLSANDIRRLENMSVIDNGDIYLQPMNFKEAGTDEEISASNKLIEEIKNLLGERG